MFFAVPEALQEGVGSFQAEVIVADQLAQESREEGVWPIPEWVPRMRTAGHEGGAENLEPMFREHARQTRAEGGIAASIKPCGLDGINADAEGRSLGRRSRAS